MIRSEHMKSCLTAQIRFMLFKGPGSFKTNFKIGGNVDELKAYRFIPLTPPLLFHFTLPLNIFNYFSTHILIGTACSINKKIVEWYSVV
jgi:hypothetical protein